MATKTTETSPSQTSSSSEAKSGGGAASAARNCVHHWAIESPNGRESQGVCRRCGSKRSFANSTESVMWEQSNTLRATPSPFRVSPTTNVSISDEVAVSE